MDINTIKSTLNESVAELMEKISHNFSDRRGRQLARQYIIGLMSGIERKNGWQLAEALGQNTPYAIQQFLYRGVWNADE
jgi:SRSO17 transposase